MLEFEAQTEDGNSIKTDLNGVVQALAMDGVNVANVSRDGMFAFLQNPETGAMEQRSMSDLLVSNGYNIQRVMPQNANTDHVDTSLRFLVERLGSDTQRQAFLQQEMANRGLMNGTIVGGGSDWFVFDPNDNTYYALTNKKGMDWTDVGEVGPEIASGVAATVGGALAGGVGTAASGGLAAIPAMAAGAAGGGGAAEAAFQGLGAAMNPAFREVQTLGGAATKAGKEALFNAPFGALGGAGRWAGKVLPTAEEGWKQAALGGLKAAGDFLGAGGASRTARGVGSLTQTVGQGVGGAAGAVADSPLLTAIGTGMTPGLQQAQMAGFGLQVPKWAAEGIGRAPRWIGEKVSKLGQKMGSEEVEAAGWQAMLAGDDLLRPSPRSGMVGFEKGLRERMDRFKPTMSEEDIVKNYRDPNSTDVLGNVGERMGYNIRNMENVVADAAMPGGPAAVSEEALQRSAMRGRNIGQGIGLGVEGMAGLGKQLERGSENVFRAGMRGVQGIGRGMQAGGRTLKNVGAVTEPFENQVLSRQGIEEGGDWLDEMLRRKRYTPEDVKPLWAQ
jgi:hypothetical protein